MPVPPHPKIYHITSVQNLPGIIAAGELISDAAMIARGGPPVCVGMSRIKERRLHLPVDCHPGLMVGACVPFYFCSRSIMLYLLHRSDHPDLAYRGGQEPIIHMEADLHAVVAWANAANVPWAFSLSNAGAVMTEFRSDLRDLGEIDWTAVQANQWANHAIREGKQAEFLVRESFPWNLVERIGVASRRTYGAVQNALADSPHQPRVEIRPDWYY